MQKCAKDNWAARAAHENIESQYQKQCDAGFLGNFLSKGLKTNQLVLNTDEKTLRPIARLKEPRDLFALPKDKDNDCSQQAPRWPIECQVIEERVVHIPYVPPQAEPLNVPTGNELKPRPVGEENGIIVFTYCPISAVNYENSNVKSKAEDKSSEDSDDSSDSRNDFTPLSRRMTMRNAKGQLNSISKILNSVDDRSTSNSQDEEDDDGDTSGEGKETRQVGEQTTLNCPSNLSETKNKCFGTNTAPQESSDIEDIWTSNSTEYKPASPYYVLSEFGKKVPKTMIIDKIIENDQPQTQQQQQQQQQPPSSTCNSTSSKVQNNRYAVTPFRIPKSNISRLEAAFQIPSRLTTSDKSLSNPTKKCNAAIDGKAEHNHNVLDDILMSDSECSPGRLAGGADKLPSTSSSSVSETDTLVGDETESVLPSSENKMPEATGQLAQSSSPKQTVSMAAAVAAVARGRRRGFEPVTCSSDILGLSHLSAKSINTSSTFVELSNDKSPPPSPDIDSTNETTSSFQSQPISNDIPQMQFSRSAVGGAKFVTNCHPMNAEEYDSLEFESRFESGNLAKAVQITPTYYELYLRPDLYTSRSKQWFYFRVRRTHRNMLYRFSIVNLVKSDSLYNDGMRPVMYSTLGAKEKSEGWRRCGNNISYYRNDDESNNTNEEDEDNSSYTLTFTIEFEHDDDTVYFAHSYPYTYSDLQDYLMEIQRHPVKSKFCKLRLLCRTLAGNNVYYLTVTAPSNNEDIMRRKKSIVVSARVHPSETPSSWMMKGLMDFITGDTTVAKRLRHKFIFKLVPMLNPDGVIVGNTRNSLTGKDLNRQYRTVIRETYPSIWYTKAMIRRLIEECGVAMYCDMHAHSRKHNIFIYGCENKRNPEKRLTEQVFPLMLHKNSADRFSFESCKFKIQRSKEGTGRIVVWMLGITNSYTIEASFGGSSLGSRKGTHFNTQDYEHMGRAFCETLLDYCDENPNKERLRSKIIERLMREGSSADEPLNIPLSDYSSDEGNCSSSSDNEGKHSIAASDLEGPCCAPIRAPPSSPEVMNEIRKNRRQRVRSKPLKKRGEVARTALDLPTTDPGSDLHFSTDDEELSPTGKEGFGAVAPLRHTLLQSELQRRYIEEIGDMVVKKPKAVHHHMPPELIVTTPSKITGPGGVKTLEIYKLTPRTAPEQQEGVSQVKTGHAISPAARRTYSWHNLNQESGHARPNFFAREPKPSVKIYRAPPRRNVPSNFIPLAQQRNGGNADDLQLKLSLKKKIWTGAHGEPENRPLAWYKGNQCKAHPQLANVMASAAAAATAMRSGGGQAQNVFGASNKELMASAGGTATTPLPPAYVGAPRRSRKVDQVDLFNACSQKLLMWQQEHKKLQPMHARLMGGTSTSVKLDDSHVQMRTSKPKKGTKTASDSEVVASTGKGKRKSSIIKIAETTQLVTRFSRTRNNTGCSGGNNNAAQKQQMTQMQRLIFKGTEQMNNASAVGLQQQSAGGRTASKFKTGGIVVTAVQQSIVSNTVAGSAGGVSRRMRHAGLVHLKSGPTTVVDDDNAVQYRRNSSSVQINKPTTAGGISLDTVSLVRKVKTKLKKRKSRTLAKAASAAVK